ncbi:MAG: Uma2 family endonuclease [Planctomycetia bacterium]|nr:Uma2 family endonuclease [Planctomycetia bacterium]
MKAVIPCVHESLLAERKRLGHDQYDEMWEGVLHMAPMPNMEHQEFETDLQDYLRRMWAARRGGRVLHQINLTLPGAGEAWLHNYRIPDLLLISRDRLGIRHGSHCEGPPNVVVEIHSAGDESYEKLPFYAELGVPEVWIIHRDSKAVEVFRLHEATLKPTGAGAGGWVPSPETGLEMRPAPGGKLSIRVAGDDATREELPCEVQLGRVERESEGIAMKAVIPCVQESFLEQRKRLGHDQYDEMWEGVLHMAPMPNMAHQDFESELEEYLKQTWGARHGGLVRHQINLTLPGAGEAWLHNYRIPDLILISRDRIHIRHGSHCEGPPNVVIEIHSAGDESYEKLPFYAELGVPEVWIIHRDSKAVEIFLLREGTLTPKAAGADGWVHSPETGLEMRPAPGGKLSIRVAGDDGTREELPCEV